MRARAAVRGARIPIKRTRGAYTARGGRNGKYRVMSTGPRAARRRRARAPGRIGRPHGARRSVRAYAGRPGRLYAEEHDKAVARWQREGVADGAAWRSAYPAGTEDELSAYVQRAWTKKILGRVAAPGKAEHRRLIRWGTAYAAGIGQGSGLAPRCVPIPLRGTAAAVVYASDGEGLPAVLDELERLPLREIVVVLGTAQHPGFEALLSRPRVVTAYSPNVYANPHAARAAGARLTGADMVLFADGAKPCGSRLLGQLLLEADTGAGAALSDRTVREGSFNRRGEASWLREFLNVSLGRPELRSNAVGGVPFALTRRALKAIGPDALGTPAKAHAAVLLAGLEVTVCEGVPYAGEPEAADAAANDHKEAWRDCLTTRGARLRFPDAKRNRLAIRGGSHGQDDGRRTEL